MMNCIGDDDDDNDDHDDDDISLSECPFVIFSLPFNEGV